MQISLKRQSVLGWLTKNSNNKHNDNDKKRAIVYTTLFQQQRSSGSVHGLLLMHKNVIRGAYDDGGHFHCYIVEMKLNGCSFLYNQS